MLSKNKKTQLNSKISLAGKQNFNDKAHKVAECFGALAVTIF